MDLFQGMQGWLNTQIDKCIYHISQLKARNDIITLISVEIDIFNILSFKLHEETNRRNISQHNKGYIWQNYNTFYAKWRKLQSLSIKWRSFFTPSLGMSRCCCTASGEGWTGTHFRCLSLPWGVWAQKHWAGKRKDEAKSRRCGSKSSSESLVEVFLKYFNDKLFSIIALLQSFLRGYETACAQIHY